MNPIEQARQLGQAMWSDYIRRGLLTSGEFKQLIAQGISGVTSNPTILRKLLSAALIMMKRFRSWLTPIKAQRRFMRIWR